MIKHLLSEKPVLIIAQSARMLASMAVAAGLKIVVIDVYADVDTRQMALACYKVTDCSLAQVTIALQQLAKQHDFDFIIYGSGLEAFPDTLAYLATQGRVLGNDDQLFKQIHDKQAFFAGLKQLNIPFPSTQFTTPEASADWLFKPLIGQGGLGIRHFSSKQTFVDGYWQQYLPGKTLSVCFIAGVGQYQVLGFNQQWQHRFANQAFLFAGVHNQADLALALQQQIRHWLEKLLKVYPLIGLASLDFIVYQDQLYLLEINPRPPASAQLYGAGVLERHIQACLLDTPLKPLLPVTASAYQIIYAQQVLKISAGIYWPNWAHDLPEIGVIIHPGQPICSIISNGNTVAQALDLLGQRRHYIEQILSTGH